MIFQVDDPTFKELALALRHFKTQLQEGKKRPLLSKSLSNLLDAKFLNVVLGVTKDLILLYGPDNRIIYGKGLIMKQLGNVVGAHPVDIYGEEQGAKIERELQKIQLEKNALVSEATIEVLEKPIVLKQFTYPILYSRTNEILGILSISRDITESKHSLEFLAQSKDFLQGIFNHVQMGICLTDSKGNFFKVNPSYVRIYGYEEEELIGKHFTNIVPEKGKAYASDMHDRFIEGMPEIPDEWKVQHKDGSDLYVYVDAILLENEQGEKFKLTTVIDITERKLLEIELEKERQRLHQIMRLTRLCSFEFDLDNRKWENLIYLDRVLGVDSQSESLGEREYLKFFDPEAHPDFHEETVKLLEDNHLHQFEDTLYDNSGNPINVVTLLKKADTEGSSKAFAIIQDITSLKMMQKRLQEQNEALLASNNKLNLLLKVLSHDLKSPLNSAQGLISLLKTDEAAEQKEILRLLEESLGKMKGFISDLMTMVEPQFTKYKLAEIDFNKIVKSTIDNHRFDKEFERVEVRYEGKQHIAFYSIKNFIEIIFNNLISNAFKYHDPNKECPFVGINVQVDEKRCYIEVSDNGLGIPEEAQDKIFDMAFVVSKQAKSTGVGLHLVKDIVKRLNGKIEVQSTFGEGSTFKIQLPNEKSLFKKEVK